MTTAVVAAPPAGPAGVGAVLRSELIKLTSTRMIIVLAIVAAATGVAGSGIYGALGLVADSQAGDAFSDAQFVASIYSGSNQMARIVAIIAGAMAMGNEYRHKTLGTSYLAVPRRIELVLGKAAITFGFGLFLGLIATVFGFLTGLVFILAHHGSTALGTAAGWQALVFNIVTVGLWAMIGYGLGILIRNMIASVLIAVGFAYIIEPLLNLIFSVKRWTVLSNLMPSGATKAALGGFDLSGLGAAAGSTWPPLAGVLVLIGWAVIPAAIGCLGTIRRDVD